MPHSPSQRTPALVLAGVVTLVITAVLALPSPLLAGLLLAPAFLATAITGYLNFRWSPVLGAGASSATVLVAAVTALLIAVLPAAEMSFTSVLGVLLALFCAFCGLLGSGMLWLGRRTARSTSQQPRQFSPTAGDRMPADQMPYAHVAAEPSNSEWTAGATSTATTSRSLKEDALRVGAAAASGAGHAASAWRTGKAHTEPWRQRNARRREARAERRRSELSEQNRLKRAGEEAEIHKARLQQAKDYNRSRFRW